MFFFCGGLSVSTIALVFLKWGRERYGLRHAQGIQRAKDVDPADGGTRKVDQNSSRALRQVQHNLAGVDERGSRP